MRADEQLRVIRAACASTDLFVNAVRLGAATGLEEKKCGLVPTFMFKTGLLEPAGGHFSRFRPTNKARSVAAAWEKGEEAGLQALRSAWKGQWFARAMRERLGYGPVPRDGLVARLLTSAHAERHRMRQAEILLDLMVAIGMVVPDGDGFMSWHEGPCHRGADQPGEHRKTPLSLEADPSSEPSEGSAAVLTEDVHRDTEAATHTLAAGEEADAPKAAIPRPRRRVAVEAHTEAVTGSYADLDLLALLCPPVLLADLVRLSQDELLELHKHLRGLAALTAKLRGRPVA
ncbi:hypothetical protein [Streptomyces chryseus]|nr:hypothetical protein [Streptomyces chryseus]